MNTLPQFSTPNTGAIRFASLTLTTKASQSPTTPR